MLLCTAKEALVKQIAFSHILHTEVFSKPFYSLTIVFFPTNSLDKASKLLFIFIRVHREHLLSIQKDCLFLVAYKTCTIVSQLLNACKNLKGR